MSVPRVLIGCPTSYHKRYCLRAYIEGLRKLTYPNTTFIIVENSQDDVYFNEIRDLTKDMPNFILEKGPWFDGAKDRIIASRNQIRQYAVDHDFDYFLSLEQDVVLQDPDAVQKMVAHHHDIVAGVVIGEQLVNGQWAPAPMLYVSSKVDPEKMWFLDPAEIKKPQLIEIRATALGCVLMSRTVLEKITFRYAGGFDDMMFSMDARAAGFKIFCDTTIRTAHHQKPGAWDTIQK